MQTFSCKCAASLQSWTRPAFVPAVLTPPCFGAAANVASLPDNHLAAGQPAMKLRDDLFAAKNSADLLSEMLASISIHDPVDVKQVWILATELVKRVEWCFRRDVLLDIVRLAISACCCAYT